MKDVTSLLTVNLMDLKTGLSPRSNLCGIKLTLNYCMSVVSNLTRIMSKNNCSNYTNNVKKLKLLDATVQNLIREATEARENAYCPYSKFKVGCAVLCADGTIFAGCNIENASFNVGVCAERCAYSKAISCGKLKFKAVAVVAYQENSFPTPCGACRQFISEFGDVDIYIAKPGHDDVLVLDLEKLLPYRFETVDHTFT